MVTLEMVEVERAFHSHTPINVEHKKNQWSFQYFLSFSIFNLCTVHHFFSLGQRMLDYLCSYVAYYSVIIPSVVILFCQSSFGIKLTEVNFV
jgi:hypothetical protein